MREEKFKVRLWQFGHSKSSSDFDIEKTQILGAGWPNIGIITAYNDMLSAHAPYQDYPEIIRNAAREVNAIAQVAGGVPAMCDGVTQGFTGMELSLFSRDVIAMASAIGLSHDVFDGAMHLGVCDKIVPGLVIAALRFGWIPSIFVPAGPMPSGLPNPEKQPDGEVSDAAFEDIGNVTWGDEGAWVTDGGGGPVWDSIVYDEVNDQILGRENIY